MGRMRGRPGERESERGEGERRKRHTETPTSCERVDELVGEQHDEDPGKPAGDVGGGGECPGAGGGVGLGVAGDLEQDVDGVEVEEGLEGDVGEDEEGPEEEVGPHAGGRAAEELDAHILGLEAGQGQGKGAGHGDCLRLVAEVHDAHGAGGGSASPDG